MHLTVILQSNTGSTNIRGYLNGSSYINYIGSECSGDTMKLSSDSNDIKLLNINGVNFI